MSHVSILTPHIPFICKLSPILAWAGVPKNLESFELPLQRPFSETMSERLAWYLTVGLLPSPNTTVLSDEITKQIKEIKENLKREMELVDLTQKQ